MGRPKNPTTKAARNADPQYLKLPTAQKYERAITLVLDEGFSISMAARKVGVSRPRLSEAVKERRELLAEQELRASNARRERVEAYEQSQADSRSLVDISQITDIGLPEQPNAGTAHPLDSQERRIPSFREFNRLYFTNEECPDCGEHHETPDYQLQMMDLLEDRKKRFKLINCPPYHAKSTIATFKSTLYEIMRDPSSRTAIISAGSALAEAMLYQIKEHLTDEDLYRDSARNFIEDWGPFYNKNAWSNNQIYIAGRSGAQKDPTVSVYGFGTKIYGRRFDRMIFDDVADLDNQNTPEAIDKMYKKIWQEYANRAGMKTGQFIFVGTRVAAGDIYSKLDDIEDMAVMRFPCILDEDEGLTLWPDHFPIGAAKQMRSSMPSIEQWQLVYQNVDTPGLGSSFPLEVLEKAHDPARLVGHYEPEWALVAGVDPAGAGQQAGFTAMILLGVDLRTGMRYLVDIVNVKQMKAHQIKDQMLAWADQYPTLREFRVEVNGLQNQIFQYDKELVQNLTNRGVRLVPHITHGKNKWDPQFGVEAMATSYHNGLVSTPWGDVNARRKFRELDEQLMQFPMGSVSDLVMARWFAELAAREVFQRHTLPAFDPRMKAPKRIQRGRHVVDFSNREVRGATHTEVSGGSLFGEPVKPESFEFVNVAGTVKVY